ncbi:MAG: histone [Streptomycetaceae bacterium]|nr:histone [Streptomycetaceae bacterium]
MRDALRTCLQIAGGLTEATRRRASETARHLLDQAGVDLDELQRKVSDRIPPEVQTLADELITAGRANRDLLAGLIREEVDKTMARIGHLADDVTKVGVILEALERRVRRLEDTKPAPTGGVQMAPARERISFAEEAGPTALTEEAGPIAPPEEAAPEAVAAAPRAVPVKKAATKKAAPVKKTAAKKIPAKKTTPAKKTAVKQGAAKKAAAKSAAVKKAPPVKKASPASPARDGGEARDE